MQLDEYVDEILLKLGNGVVNVELEENQMIQNLVKAALREVQRYINITKYATLQYAKCIDLSKCSVYAVTQVMRTTPESQTFGFTDAIYLSLSSISGGSSNLTDYRSYLRTKQIKNSLTTDLDFIWDNTTSRLYVTTNYPTPPSITIAYIPKFGDVSEVTDPYWEDIICRLALALSKETLGRIRGKYNLSNALYTLDAEQLLQEGREELQALRESLQENADMVLPLN